MRKLLFSALFLLSLGLFSQAPQRINYQGVARNSSGTALAGVSLTVTIDISGVFTESHNVTTNAVGIFILPIGGGTTITGSFGAINWASGSNNISVTIDAGSGPQSLGPPQQLISVPYALYADKAGSAPSPTLAYSGGVLTVGTNTVPLASAAATSLTAGTNISIANAAQSFTISSNPTLSYGSDTLRISGGNYVVIPAPMSYSAGASISIVGGVISNAKPDLTVVLTPSTNVGITGTYPSFSISATPTLSIAGSALSISGGNTVLLPTSGTVAAIPNTSVTGTGIANVTTSGTNTFNIQVPGPAISVAGNAITITQGSVISTATISTGITPTINSVGVVTVTPVSGNNFTVVVPPTNIAFTPSTSILSFSPALGTNTVLIPGTNLWSASGGTAIVTTNLNNLVGIGSNNPTENLQVQSSLNSRISILSGGTNVSSLYFGTNALHLRGHISYNNANNAMSFWTGGIQDRLFIDGAGNVGVGAGSPVENLQVQATNNTQVSIISTAGQSGGVSFGSTGNHFLGNIFYDITNNSFNFWTNNTANRLFIDALGNIGMGTNFPVANLDVNGNIRSNGGKLFLGAVSGVNSGYTGIYEKNSDLLFAVFNSSGGSTPFGSTNTMDAMVVKANTGNVGIGTLTPGNKLHVAGGGVTIVDGTQGQGKVLTSDASGNATWEPVSLVTQIAVSCQNIGVVGVAPSKFSTDLAVFTKVKADTKIEVILQTDLNVWDLIPPSNCVRYELRLSGISSSGNTGKATYYLDNAGAAVLTSAQSVTIIGEFLGLPNGVYNVELWASSPAGGSASNVYMDMGCFGASSVIIKEYR